jgi:hypothetical protein
MGILKSFFFPESNETMLRQVGEYPTPEAAAPPPEAQVRYSVEFTAVTGEYFRIWVVNLALTLVWSKIWPCDSVTSCSRYG